jgi:streptomycin 6-kinase
VTARPQPGRLCVPPALAAAQQSEQWRAWVADLPTLAREFLERWHLRPDGAPTHGAVALVLPVRRLDGSPAVLKLQPVDEETRGEPIALRAWGRGLAAELLDSDPDTGTLLLERLDASRSLAAVPDDTLAVRELAELLAALVAHPAPAGLPRLADLAAAMLHRLPRALPQLAAPADRQLLATCGAAVRELLAEPGDQLLHWDLHYDNVLAPLPGYCQDRSRWLAIDPKPLAGDPGFELLPALRNRWEDVVATGDVTRAVRHRFRLLTDTLDLDRLRATGWTLGRILQNTLWDLADGATAVDPVQVAIAGALLEA